MKEIRNWFARIYPDRTLPGADSIWRAFSQFSKGLQKKLKDGWSQEDISSMQMSEYRRFAFEWIKKQEKDEMIH